MNEKLKHMNYDVASRIANDYQNAKRPNVLLILTDQQQCSTIGAYGNKAISTPHIDSIASQGVVFDRAYTTCPLCAPARSSLFSGLYINQTGLPVNDDDARIISLDDSIVTIGDVLKQAQYKCGYFGKWHMGREEIPQHGFTDGWFVHLRNSYENWLEKQNKFSFPAKMESYDRRGVVPFELAHDTEVTKRAISYIEAHRHERFFCVCALRAPHDPFVGPFDGHYKPEDVLLPDNLEDDLEDKPIQQKHCMARRLGTEHRTHEPEEFKKTIAGYWNLVHLVDVNVGRLLRALEDNRLVDNTIVMFAVDHGEMMGAHGLLTKGPFMYEETNRVPLIMRYPSIIPGSVRIPELVSMIDYAPTLIDYAELPVPPSMKGQSLRPLIDHHARKKGTIVWRDAVFSELYETYTQRCPIWNVTTQRWKYNYYFGDRDELYDLDNDPLELRNLAQKQSYRDVLFEMRRRLVGWAKSEGGFSLHQVVNLSMHTISPGVFQ